MKIERLTAKEFNYYLERANFDKHAVEVLYKPCTEVIKVHVLNRYGLSNFYDTIPHDVFTRIVFEHPPNNYIKNPTGYLCRAARNYMLNMYKLKDNQTLELFENLAYIPEYENTLEFEDEAAEKAWYKLDKESRYILYLSEIRDYSLEDIAEILSKSYESIKSKKWRAKEDFKKYMKQIKQNTEVIL